MSHVQLCLIYYNIEKSGFNAVSTSLVLNMHYLLLYQNTAHWLLLYYKGIIMLLSYDIVDFHFFYDGLLMLIWALLTRSQCRVSDTQVTIKAHRPFHIIKKKRDLFILIVLNLNLSTCTTFKLKHMHKSIDMIEIVRVSLMNFAIFRFITKNCHMYECCKKWLKYTKT